MLKIGFKFCILWLVFNLGWSYSGFAASLRQLQVVLNNTTDFPLTCNRNDLSHTTTIHFIEPQAQIMLYEFLPTTGQIKCFNQVNGEKINSLSYTYMAKKRYHLLSDILGFASVNFEIKTYQKIYSHYHVKQQLQRNKKDHLVKIILTISDN